jgi:glyoxylase-like metal-dependent hydrolase (beta-lactamase superfamily II)
MAQYSIWVVEFASIRHFPDALMIAGTLGTQTRRLPYTYVVVQGNGRTILIDVGFDHRDYAKALVDTMGLDDWQPPRVALGSIGIVPEQITDILITHAHFDHMGGMDFFPNSTFYIQERELTKWVWSLSLEREMQKLHFTVNPQDILRAVQLSIEGRLKFVQGDADDFFPGIDLRLAADSHTWGSMYVTVRNDGQANSRDPWVLAGDLVYAAENLGLAGPTPGVYSAIAAGVGGQYALLEATRAMVESAGGDPSRVIPAHEDRLSQRFPSRVRKNGLRVTEIALADGASSKVA